LLVGKVSVPMRTSLKEVKIWKKKTATCIWALNRVKSTLNYLLEQ
jgi:hypothetical protein